MDQAPVLGREDATIADLFDYLRACVVRIDIHPFVGERGFGTGFVIHREGNEMLVLTCGHLAGCYDDLDVMFSDGSEAEAFLITDSTLTRREISLIRVNSPAVVNVLNIEYILPPLRPGMRVFMGAHSLGYISVAHTEGRVSSPQMADAHGRLFGSVYIPSLIGVDIVCSEGSSGSPVVDSEMRFVGINILSFTKQSDTFFNGDPPTTGYTSVDTGIKGVLPSSFIISSLNEYFYGHGVPQSSLKFMLDAFMKISLKPAFNLVQQELELQQRELEWQQLFGIEPLE